jgi:hypothetical protein
MKRTLLLALGMLVMGTGCFKTTIVNHGASAKGAPAAYTDRWNHNAVLGLANLSGPQDASAACPSGWATIETEQTFVQGVVGSLTGSIYTPQNLTIRCQ